MGAVPVNNNDTRGRGLVEQDTHMCCEQKEVSNGSVGEVQVSNGVVGDGQALGSTEEDESRINEVTQDVSNGPRGLVQVHDGLQILQQQQQQQQGPVICWERFLPTRSLKVLLVENDDSTRQVVSALLRNCSYEVTAVANGIQAWKILEDPTNHIDLVLTEVVMPLLSGIGLLCKLMNRNTLKNIPVIMMSSHDSMGIVFKCLSKGAVDFLVKPIRKNELKNLWQHVWRRCHSSSGSGSESGTQTRKSVKSKINDESENNTGSSNEQDNGSNGLNIQDGSDNGSGTQSSWTKRAAEVESPQAISPQDQMADAPDSTCAQVIHTKPEKFSNRWLRTTETQECPEQDEQLDNLALVKDKEIGASENPDLPHECPDEMLSIHLQIRRQNKLPEEDTKPLDRVQLEDNSENVTSKPGNQSSNIISDIVNSTDPEAETRDFDPPNGLSDISLIKAHRDSRQVPSLELTLKRLREDVGDVAHDDRNVLRHSDLSAFSKYNTASSANKGHTGNVGGCSPLDNSSVTLNKETMHNFPSHSSGSPPNQQSNVSSSNNDMASTNKCVIPKAEVYDEKPESLSGFKSFHSSAFQPVQNGYVSSSQKVTHGKSADAEVNKVQAQTRCSKQKVQIQHHHHHHHHYHHHVHNTQQHQLEPDEDQSLGVVYGDLSISPLYVYKTTFSGKLSLNEDDEEIFGVLSFIFWTITLIALFKYVFIVMSADDNGEGGTFALYSLLCRHAGLGILPNHQAVDESLPAYFTEASADTWQSSVLKSFLEKHPRFRTGLLIFVLLGTCMAIGDGVLTPAISVLSAVSGVKLKITELHENYVVIISCVILVGLFSLQHNGTHRVAFLFAPIVTAWLLCLTGIGVYNIFQWNPHIYRALSPTYMLKLLKTTSVEGWVSLGGVVLAITGVEAMFANLGHFSPLSIKMAFTFLVYPSLLLTYMGEAAFLSKHREDIQRSFYKAIPEPVFWPVFVVATFAAVVGSQAVISATFSIISQCCALNCFPNVRIVHTSSKIYGQIYIPEVNWLLLCLSLAVTIGLRDTNRMGHAYGLAVTTVMFVTTCLMALVMIIVWKQKIITAVLFLLSFGSMELLYISACIFKVPEGAWIALIMSSGFMAVMYIWYYGTMKKHQFDVENKISINRIVAFGPSLGMVRVPGIGLVYTNLVTGVPAIFGHFVTNLPAFHQVLVFVCIKSVQVPYVGETERILISRVGPKECGMYRCILRYGYKDLHQETYNFENRLVSGLVHFVETEEEKSVSKETLCSTEEEDNVRSSLDGQVMTSGFGQVESFLLKDESLHILKAKESGVTYIFGHSYAKAKKSSPVLKKFVVNVVYAFLSKNCTDPNVLVNVSPTSLLEVGMIYYV